MFKGRIIQHEKNVEDYTLSEEMLMLNLDERNIKDLYSYFVGIKMKYKEIGVGNNSVMCGYCKREYEVVEEFYNIERSVKDLQEKYVMIGECFILVYKRKLFFEN